VKKSPKSVAQPTSCKNVSITCAVVKNGPTIWATFVIFKNHPRVNNRPTGENSPNLVTLIGGKKN
jgi:hypothetical protein